MIEKTWEIGEPQFEADQECVKFRIWPWHGHRRFAYDLIRFIKPERIVELGTYWGTSFFAFCQAVKDCNLTTECVAIDTWEGDEHTGKYNSEAFETFCRIKKQLFSGINILFLPFFSIISS
ncbi:MAG: class I SAM-dependent methyltransferase, partial [Candidatus Zixiibacteriota bacterium]